MITWLTLWPFTLIPLLLVFVLGILPVFDVLNTSIGGAFVREWFLNHTVLPVMSDSMATVIVTWFRHASLTEEVFLHLLVSLNVWALCFPVMYFIGQGIIGLYSWYSKTQLKQKQNLLNQKL